MFLDKIKSIENEAIPCVNCPLCIEFPQRIVEGYERCAGYHDSKRRFEQWKQSINNEWRQHEERCHQDIEIFVDQLVSMRMQLREMEPQTSSMWQPKYKSDGSIYPGYKRTFTQQ